MEQVWGKNYKLIFLYYFNLKERHYIETSIFPCNWASTLPFPTTAGVVEMFLPVLTLSGNFISTGFIRGEFLLCFTNLSIFLPTNKGGFPTFISFSLREIFSVFSINFIQPLQILKLLPSVLYNSEGRR